MSDLNPFIGQREARLTDTSSSNDPGLSEDNRDHEHAEIVVGQGETRLTDTSSSNDPGLSEDHKPSEVVSGSGGANSMERLRRSSSWPRIPYHPEGEGSENSPTGRVPPVFVAGEVSQYSRSTRSKLIIDILSSSDVSAAAGHRRKRRKKPARPKSLTDHDKSKKYSTGSASTGPSSNGAASTTTTLSSSDTDANSGVPGANPDGPDANSNPVNSSPSDASGVSGIERTYGQYKYVCDNINRQRYLIKAKSDWEEEREIEISPDFKFLVTFSFHPCITNSEGEYVLQMKISTNVIQNKFPEFTHSSKVSTKLVSFDSNEIFGKKIKTYIFKENSGFNVFVDLALQERISKAVCEKLRLEVTLEVIQDKT